MTARQHTAEYATDCDCAICRALTGRSLITGQPLPTATPRLTDAELAETMAWIEEIVTHNQQQQPTATTYPQCPNCHRSYDSARVPYGSHRRAGCIHCGMAYDQQINGTTYSYRFPAGWQAVV